MTSGRLTVITGMSPRAKNRVLESVLEVLRDEIHIEVRHLATTTFLMPNPADYRAVKIGILVDLMKREQVLREFLILSGLKGIPSEGPFDSYLSPGFHGGNPDLAEKIQEVLAAVQDYQTRCSHEPYEPYDHVFAAGQQPRWKNT